MTTPNAGIPEVPEGTLDPAAGLNLSLRVIDALLQIGVIELGRNAPPVSPADGDLYIVGIGSGAWAGQDDNLARYVAAGAFWQFFSAGTQVRYLLNQEDFGLYVYTNTGGWVSATQQNVSTPPIVTEATSNLDATVSNSGNYTRFTHASPTYTFDLSGAFVAGAEYHGRYMGSGQLTLVPSGGFVINAPAGGTLVIPIGGTFTVKIVSDDEGDLMGLTEPST